jgi:hypothetical protein
LARVKKKDYEDLSDTNIKKVIALLLAENPITKKEACEILNISYNTTRLQKIIDDYNENVAYRKLRMSQKRGRPADNSELKEMIEAFLSGEPIADISRSVYRSTAFVKSCLERIGVPERATGDDKLEMAYLPDECLSEDFSVDEIAWSAKYHSACIITKQLPEKYTEKYGTKCYEIYVKEPSETDRIAGFCAAAPSYDLGKLEHLKQFGVNVSKI